MVALQIECFLGQLFLTLLCIMVSPSILITINKDKPLNLFYRQKKQNVRGI